MANIGSLLKGEIARVARKEIRAEITSLKKASSQYRSSIAAMRRELQALKKQLRTSGGQAEASGEQGGQADEVKRRFSAARLTKHRQALGLSAQEYGKLIGVSGQSIYKWEAGAVRPRPKQIQALAGIRALGKRQVAAQLEESAKSQPPKRAPAKRAAAKRAPAKRAAAKRAPAKRAAAKRTRAAVGRRARAG